MKLLVDLGNSRLKWAWATAAQWTPGGSEAHPDVDLSVLLDSVWGVHPAPRQIVLASVAAPARTQELIAWSQRRWTLTPHVVRAQAALLGVQNLYEDPSRLGADRWAALIAARALTSHAACVVDCGTAVTVDALSAGGEFLGGVILPGLRLAPQCLLAHTQLHDIDGEDVHCFARNTGDGVAAGALFGLAGGIDRIIEEFSSALGATARVIVTGGDAARIAPRLRHPAIEAPDLVLKGLALIGETVA
jgi:type III pantothenate kinase